MRNVELRRACQALVHNRVRATTPGNDPEPIALGYQLEQGGISQPAMVALCSGVLRGARGADWRPSSTLRSLLLEYGIASGKQRPAVDAGAAQASGPAATDDGKDAAQ